MLELLRLVFINTAHAQVTTTASFTTYLINQFYDLFWTPFGAWALFALGIAIAMMIWRRIRGTARSPR